LIDVSFRHGPTTLCPRQWRGQRGSPSGL